MAPISHRWHCAPWSPQRGERFHTAGLRPAERLCIKVGGRDSSIRFRNAIYTTDGQVPSSHISTVAEKRKKKREKEETEFLEYPANRLRQAGELTKTQSPPTGMARSLSRWTFVSPIATRTNNSGFGDLCLKKKSRHSSSRNPERRFLRPCHGSTEATWLAYVENQQNLLTRFKVSSNALKQRASGAH